MKTPGIFIGALGVCVVVALVVGLAGAAIVTPHVFGKANGNVTSPGQGHGAPEKILEQLQQQGVDVSVPMAAIRNGDNAALKTWLDAYRGANPRNMTANENRPGPEKFLEQLQQKGVDVSVPMAAIRTGDNAALKTWLDEFRASHTGEMRGNRTAHRTG